MGIARFKKIKKIANFVGSPRIEKGPLFINSIPKSGTNLVENFFLGAGYKRCFSRCLNESNLLKSKVYPKDGRFYVGHLFDEKGVFCGHRFDKIFLKREFFGIVRSFVNYMFLDDSHPVSSFITERKSLEAVEALCFSSDNPFGRPYLKGLSRFYGLDFRGYALIIDYDEFCDSDPELVGALGRFLDFSPESVRFHINQSLENDSFTKSAGRFDLFNKFPKDEVDSLKDRIEEYELQVKNGVILK